MKGTVSLHEIATSWRGERGYPIHWHAIALRYAAKGVQTISRRSFPMLHHVLLTRQAGASWFTLPDGFENCVKVGIRHGDTWFPLRIDESLMPFLNRNGQGDLDPDEFGEDLNTDGAFQSWYAGQTTPASFSGASFSSGSFQTSPTTTTVTPSQSPYGNWWGGLWPYYSRYGVSIDLAQGVIITREHFPFDELYLVYTGSGNIDSMTSIPVLAQPCIESYIDWKYEQKKRGASMGAVQKWEDLFWNEERLLRAQLQPLSISDIISAFEKPFSGHGQTGQSYNTQSSGRIVETVLMSEFDITATTATDTLTSNQLAGVNVSRISYGGQSYNAAFFTKNIADNFLRLTTPGVTFFPGQLVTITPK